MAAEEPGFEWPELDERSAAAMCYTSGTTGSPKGVVYSHRSMWLHTQAAAVGVVGGDDREGPHPDHCAHVPRHRLGHALRGLAGRDRHDHAADVPHGGAAGQRSSTSSIRPSPAGCPRSGTGCSHLDSPIDFSTMRAITAGGAAVPAVADRGVRGAVRRDHHPGLGHDRDQPAGRLRPPAGPPHRRPRRHVLQDQGRPGRRRGRGARRRRGRLGAAQRRQVHRRVRDPRPVDHRLLLQGRRPGEVPRRLALHRRRRHARPLRAT